MILKRILKLILILISFTACTVDEEVVNVYTSRHYQTDEEIFNKFTEQTGIKVNTVKADADQLINRLLLERGQSPADLLITVDAGRLNHAKFSDLLQTVNKEELGIELAIHLYDNDLYWYGLSKRARVIVYSRERVVPENLNNYEDLVKQEWKGRILMRSSQNIYNQSLLASMIAAEGEEFALNWVKGIVNNMDRNPRGNDRDQLKAVFAGNGDISIVNTYYIGLMLNSSNSEDVRVAEGIGIIFPDQAGRGTHINVSGMGVARNAPNRENAIKLMKFLLSKEIQEYIAENNYEYPVNNEAQWPELLLRWGNFKEDKISLSELGKYHNRAIEIFNEGGWR